MVQAAEISDSGAIARLHGSTLKSGFLPSLGAGFLTTLYKYLIKNEIVLVFRRDEDIGGFISCALDSGRVMKRFMFLSPMGVFRILVAILRKPALIVHVIETWLIPSKSHSGRGEEQRLPRAELLSVCVVPEYQKEGIGTMLLEGLEHRLREEHEKQYKVIAGAELTGANNFYLKNGFKLVKTINTHGKDLSNVYSKQL